MLFNGSSLATMSHLSSLLLQHSTGKTSLKRWIDTLSFHTHSNQQRNILMFFVHWMLQMKNGDCCNCFAGVLLLLTEIFSNYTGGIPQRLDTDACVLRCNSENKHSAAAAKTSKALWQQWWWQCWDNDVHISVTAMTTDSAVTALLVATTFTLMWTSQSHQHEHRCHSAVSVATAVTLVCTVMLQRCYCHRFCTVVSFHR